MKIYLSIFFISLFFIGSAVAQQKFEPNTASRNQAITSGQGREFLAAMEALGEQEATKERWVPAAVAYQQASVMAWLTGQFQKAITDATKSLEAARRGRSPTMEVYAMIALATAYRNVRQPEKARNLLIKALEISSTVQGDKTVLQANLYTALGEHYLREQDRKQAIEYLAHALAIWESQETYLKRANARRDLASVQDRILLTRQRLGSAYLGVGNPQEAIKTLEPAVELLKARGIPTSIETPILQTLGGAYAARKDYPRALEFMMQALANAEARQHHSALPGIGRAIARIFVQTGKPAEAVPYYKKAIDSIESSRSFLQSEDLRKSFFEDKGQLYSGIIEANLSSKNLEDGFNYNERARSRAFLDILGSKVQLARHSATLADEEKTLQSKISELKNRAAGSQSDEPAGEDADNRNSQAKELSVAEKAYADFLAKVRKENKEQASLMTVEPLTVKQVQAMLDSSVTLLEYYVTNESVIAWVLGKDSVQSVQIPFARKELQAQVTAFRESISQLEEPSKLNRQAEQLHKLLIQPALAHIKSKELIIIPHDVLHYLPFQALLSPQGKYLIEDYPINYLSSASLMQFTQEKRKAKGELTSILAQGGKVLTFGNPDLGDPKMNLSFAGIEAKEIKSLYPQSAIYLETEATEERAKSLVGSNDIIHFASHAELSEDDPLSSAILLAKSDKEDGRLEVREIFGMDLKASLVVLSACETGLGKLSSGDELVGLTRAFIYAGTPSVVASLWNVEDSSTAQLMASFYKNLKTMTKVEALRQAQLQLIRGNVNSELLARRGIGGVGKLGETLSSQLPAPSSELPASVAVSTSHPYFWAPFILVGEGK